MKISLLPIILLLIVLIFLYFFDNNYIDYKRNIKKNIQELWDSDKTSLNLVLNNDGNIITKKVFDKLLLELDSDVENPRNIKKTFNVFKRVAFFYLLPQTLDLNSKFKNIRN